MSHSVAGSVGLKVFISMVMDVYKYAVKYSERKFKYWNTEKKIEQLYRKISKVRKVKTIWQIDKAVDLKSFYCDSHIILDKERIRVDTYADFKINDNILIDGIAGQGKSILLRYICSNELVRGQYIPIFLELRKITDKESLMNRILITLDQLGISADEKLFRALAASGRILLLLDGFDEVSNEVIGDVVKDIEDIALRNDKLRMIVTSRPNSGIEMCSQLRVVKLDNLRGKEYKTVITKLSKNEKTANQLINHIEKEAAHIKSLLKTPLMISLLIISYKSYNKLPHNLSDFYDELFQTLLQRHDGTKPGFVRKRRCKIDDNTYRAIFESFCIFARENKKSYFTRDRVLKIVEKAIIENKLSISAQDYLEDIVKITCLVIKEGNEYRFIHKTVQEYYTASYISNKPDIWVSKFYAKLTKIQTFEWRQELLFLEEIDEYRFHKYFELPLLLFCLKIKESDLEKRPGKELDKFLNTIVNDIMDKFLVNFSSESEMTLACLHDIFNNQFFEHFEFDLYTKFSSHTVAGFKLQQKLIIEKLIPEPEDESGCIPLAFFKDQIDFYQDVRNSISNMVNRLFQKAYAIRKSIIEAEQTTVLDEMLNCEIKDLLNEDNSIS